MLKVKLEGSEISIGERFSVSFQRTLRVPDDGRDYPLPPGLGPLPLHKVSDFRGRVPSAWEGHAFFTPMYQREALWIAFHAAYWKPNVVKVGVGGINAVSGEPWDLELCADPQNYLVAPDQPWLDGINSGRGAVSQFVAAPLGRGYTVEAQLTGAETRGGIQIVVYEPKPGIFPDEPPQTRMLGYEESAPPEGLGIAAGGKIKQKLYPDPYGIGTWDRANYGEIHVFIVNSEHYVAITGQAPPPTPVSAELYTYAGLPWFELYDEEAQDVMPSERLGSVQTVRELDAQLSGDASSDERISVLPQQIQKLRRKVPTSRTRSTARGMTRAISKGSKSNTNGV